MKMLEASGLAEAMAHDKGSSASDVSVYRTLQPRGGTGVNLRGPLAPPSLWRPITAPFIRARLHDQQPVALERLICGPRRGGISAGLNVMIA
jgi:hypothetical protein